VTMMGTGGIPSGEALVDAMDQVMTRGARGELRIETQRVALADVESVWGLEKQSGKRIVLVP
jgi:hypothetical protein